MSFARALAISYGGFTVGDSPYFLHGFHAVRRGFVVASVEYEFDMVAPDAATFAARCVAIEDAFRLPDKDLVIVQAAGTTLSFAQATDTGFDAMPSITKRGSERDAELTRHYAVRIEFGQPGGRAGYTGLRQSTVSGFYLPNRAMRVTVAGEFTAAASASARAQYNAQIAALSAAATGMFAGVFELVEEDALNTTNNKTLSFRRVYDEVIFDQGGGGLTDAAIVRQFLVVGSREDRSTIQGRGAQGVNLTTVTYECWIDKTVSQDLSAQWARIKPWAVTKAINALGGSGSVTSIEPRYHHDANRITATMTVATKSNDLISYVLVTQDEFQLGKVFVPVWEKDSPFSRYQYQGPILYHRTITEVIDRFGDADDVQSLMRDLDGLVDDATAGAQPTVSYIPDEGCRWEKIAGGCSVSPVSFGLSNEDGGEQLIQRSTTKIVLERMKDAKETGSNTPGGGGQGGSAS